MWNALHDVLDFADLLHSLWESWRVYVCGIAGAGIGFALERSHPDLRMAVLWGFGVGTLIGIVWEIVRRFK